MTGVPATNNTTDQTTGQTAPTAKLTADFNMFLKLLTTQLQYQDPLDPMDTSQYTQQLVSYSQVEQAMQQTSKLEEMLKRSEGQYEAVLDQTDLLGAMLDQLGSQNLTAATGYIGKEVTAYQPTAALGQDGAKWFYELNEGANSTRLKIYDSNNRLVRVLDGQKGASRHELTWDGKDTRGTAMPPGIYTLKVEATKLDSEGKDVAITSKIGVQGRVSAVEAQNGLVVLSLNGTPTSLTNIALVRN